MTAASASLTHLLSAHPLLAGLPDTPAIVATLLDGARLKQAAPGETLFYEGDAASHYLLVKSGRVEVLRYSVDGEERVFSHFHPGQLVAEVAVFMPHGRYPMTARAVGSARVASLPRSGLRRACEEHPALALRLLENFSQRIYRRVNELEWLAASTAAQRLAAYLLGLSPRPDDTPGSQPATVRLPISQRQLASRLGIRAETLSRLLAEWVEHGHVSGGRGVWTLHHPDYLHRLAMPAERDF